MNPKKRAGIAAAQYITSGMTIGLGTGSTVYYMVEEVGRRIREENLNIECVTTSERTSEQAKQLGIVIKDLDDVDHIDLTIDGADEISKDYQGIKGGGAALLFEKIVATYSNKNIWIIDESKQVQELGAFPLPIEVVPYGSEHLFKYFQEKNYKPTFRLNDTGEKLKTDGGHYIIDLHLEKIAHPKELAHELSTLVGVVEHGLFIDIVNQIIIGTDQDIKVIEVRH
ncbi:ribose-5-phosphate isomerase RpiA [Allofustis seminis]|uniref:ribose-5-phosphate isomerase RpiA n=1 Tax=Allofustis seminis TaxID=166939 RepID=UPI0003769519|nr:ribose-5-phosphate isomerase RpiA [Allofustis seminis]